MCSLVVPRKLTILIVSIDAIGHFNACIGIAQPLRDRGHKIVFAVPDSWKNKLSSHGFYEEYLTPESTEELNSVGDGNKLQIFQGIVSKMAPSFQESPIEQITSQVAVLFSELIRQAKEYDPRLVEIVQTVKPDVIIADLLMHQPAIMNAGIPWIFSSSLTPAAYSNINVPPAFSGYPTKGADPETLRIHNEKYKSVLQPIYDDFSTWVAANGGPRLKFYGNPVFLKFSPYANIYMYPEELDYTGFRANPPRFHRFDYFFTSSKESFVIPEKLKDKPGKLVYLSMGSIGCSELGLMRQLVTIFSKSPNRFIVSKGPLGDEYELADNMWGEPYLPQTAILPIVDLVITHGGNNTVTETLHFGKPMIVLPLFADQLDNAQRVTEAGLGIRLHPYKSSELEILEAVENLLADEKLATKLKSVSKRIQGANNKSRLADLVESVAEIKL